jgi:hypothetical protein
MNKIAVELKQIAEELNKRDHGGNIEAELNKIACLLKQAGNAEKINWSRPDNNGWIYAEIDNLVAYIAPLTNKTFEWDISESDAIGGSGVNIDAGHSNTLEEAKHIIEDYFTKG